MRSNVKELLDKLNGRQRWRQSRVLEVVEWIGDEQAKSFLESLTAGVPDAWLTCEAKASLERLGNRAQLRR